MRAGAMREQACFGAVRTLTGGARILAASLAGLIAVCIAGPAPAKVWQSGEQISRICKADPRDNPVAVTFCLGYLQGALDAFLIGRTNCIPAEVDANALRHAVLAHLDRHPERAEASGPMLVYDAFRAAWPACGHMPALSQR